MIAMMLETWTSTFPLAAETSSPSVAKDGMVTVQELTSAALEPSSVKRAGLPR